MKRDITTGVKGGKRKRWLLLIVPLLFVLAAGFYNGGGDVYFQIARSLDIFGKVYKEVSFNYVEQINPEDFMMSGINGMLSSLDPYTVFIDEKKKDDIDLLTSGKYGGIGISIGIRNDKITIVDLIEGYSAQRQGIRIGDVITKVNDVPINKDNFDDISNLVKGEPGTEVELTIRREESKDLVFNLVREEVQVKNVSFSGFYPENSNNVYIKLTGFSRAAGDEVLHSLLTLKNQKPINSIMLDLRGNPGGLLDASVDVCEKFLKKNQLIVSVMGRDSSNSKKYLSAEEPVAGTAKLVVLVDSGSASASEIVAGAIQDHDRGIILGTSTFGKGLVQTVIPLSYNTSLKITTAKYYTPSGRCIQKVDYFKKNKLVTSENKGEETRNTFQTDNRRTVYASGGIRPDTTVESNSDPAVVKDLITKGLIFKYATNFAGKYSKDNYAKIKDEQIFREFTDFLKTEKFVYKTEAESSINQLIATVTKENYNRKLIDELNSVKIRLQENKDFEVKNHHESILRAIKYELAIRYEGSTGRIKEALKGDRQVQIALDVVKDDNLYNHLLTQH